jgi:hypothetical protein
MKDGKMGRGIIITKCASLIFFCHLLSSSKSLSLMTGIRYFSLQTCKLTGL